MPDPSALHDASDIDFVVAGPLPSGLAKVLSGAAARFGYLLVQVIDHGNASAFVLVRTAPGLSRTVVRLDAWPHPDVNGYRFYSGSELLHERQRQGGYWLPATPTEFGCSLTRRIAKSQLTDAHAARLTALYSADPTGCEREIARFWRTRATRQLITAARSGAWKDARAQLPILRHELIIGALRRDPLRLGFRLVARVAIRARHFLQPVGGLHVVFLGPDGAGKSTVIEATRVGLGGAFSGISLQTVAPSMSQLRDGSYARRAFNYRDARAARPHALTSHSVVLSLLKAAYWLLYYGVGYQLTVRPALARGHLVLHHRHLVDALVDPKRYRYGGPRWVLQLLWRLSPKPDLVILLDAPPEQIRARKPELTHEEIVRQRRSYRTLVEAMSNGRIVDSSGSPAQTAAHVTEILLRFMAERVTRRVGLRAAP